MTTTGEMHFEEDLEFILTHLNEKKDIPTGWEIR